MLKLASNKIEPQFQALGRPDLSETDSQIHPIIAVPQLGNANIPSIDRNQFTENFFRSGNMRNAVPGCTGSGADEVPNHSYPQSRSGRQIRPIVRYGVG